MNTASPGHSASIARSLTFTQLLSPTRRGARLARLLALTALRGWQLPADVTDRAEAIVAELAANAALHAHVPGRNFRLDLSYDPAAALLRIAVTDADGDRHPTARTTAAKPLPPDAESGRGLLLVTALADRWGTTPYPPSGKTVWAECALRDPEPEPAPVARTRSTPFRRECDGPSVTL